jgi:hypothetical protein
LTRVPIEQVEMQKKLPLDIFDAHGRLLLRANPSRDCATAQAGPRALGVCPCR